MYTKRHKNFNLKEENHLKRKYAGQTLNQEKYSVSLISKRRHTKMLLQQL
jgi:hypothetical protein